jgi:hypothetical protein
VAETTTETLLEDVHARVVYASMHHQESDQDIVMLQLIAERPGCMLQSQRIQFSFGDISHMHSFCYDAATQDFPCFTSILGMDLVSDFAIFCCCIV